MQAIPIPDSPGRVIGFYERQGDVEYEDGEKAKQLLRCTFDIVRGLGTFQGYSQLIFKDGSTALVKVEGVMTKLKEGKLPAGHGTGKYICGTGRFKGIQGKNTFKVRMLKPFAGESKGDALVEVTATYSLWKVILICGSEVTLLKSFPVLKREAAAGGDLPFPALSYNIFVNKILMRYFEW